MKGRFADLGRGLHERGLRLNIRCSSLTWTVDVEDQRNGEVAESATAPELDRLLSLLELAYPPKAPG